MKKQAVLSIRGTQYYPQQEPEVIELVTDGTLEFRDGGWEICYEETDLTGMAGVSTMFRLEPGQVILERTGALRSKLVFREGVVHDSLYQMDFGVLMLSVCARELRAQVGEQGGTVDMVYTLAIEQGDAGVVEYHLDIRVKE